MTMIEPGVMVESTMLCGITYKAVGLAWTGVAAVKNEARNVVIIMMVKVFLILLYIVFSFSPLVIRRYPRKFLNILEF